MWTLETSTGKKRHGNRVNIPVEGGGTGYRVPVQGTYQVQGTGVNFCLFVWFGFRRPLLHHFAPFLCSDMYLTSHFNDLSSN